MNDDLQSCYKQCFESISCLYFKMNPNCSFVNEDSYSKCDNKTETCIEMNSNQILIFAFQLFDFS